MRLNLVTMYIKTTGHWDKENTPAMGECSKMINKAYLGI